MVFSAREGVEAQSETVWRQADKYEVPRIAFINKMDREGAEFERVFGQIKERLGANPLAIETPVGEGPSHVTNPFRGVIDLVRMKLVTYELESEGKVFSEHDVPEDQLENALLWRETLIDELSNHSEKLMELALGEQEIPEDLIHEVLREATLSRSIQPVLCGSALHGIGVQPLLDGVCRYLPSPLDVPSVRGTNPFKKKTEEERRPSEKDPVSYTHLTLPTNSGV